MTTKERLHQLVDRLPKQRLDDAESILEALEVHNGDPLARKLVTAPLDDELESEEERRAVAQARDALAQGEIVKDEQLDRELGW
ncbi:MAG: hypothetical protein ACRDHX_07025 [Chloroflexota bacterium]